MKTSSCHHYLRGRLLLAIGATSAVWLASCGGHAVSTGETETSDDDLTATNGGSNATPATSGGGSSLGGTASGGTGPGSPAVATGGYGASAGGRDPGTPAAGGGMAEGGSASTAPICEFGFVGMECLNRAQMENMARAGFGQIPREPLRTDEEVIAAFDEDGCLRYDWVGSSCCNPAQGPGVRDGESCCYSFCEGACCGRPLVIAGQVVVAAGVRRGDWIDAATKAAPVAAEPALNDAARAVLASAWLEDALMEHASVASFARFSLQLLALGAPADLVKAAQAAGLDEVKHAELAFAIASRFAGYPAGPGLLQGLQADLETDALRVMVATIVEGCVGETLAALVALERAHVAQDPSIAEALATIAEDEVRHSELAFQFVAWAIRSGGAPYRAAARQAFESALDRAHSAPAAELDEKTLHYFGRLSAAEERLIHARGVEQVLRPAMLALTGDAGASAEDQRATSENLC